VISPGSGRYRTATRERRHGADHAVGDRGYAIAVMDLKLVRWEGERRPESLATPIGSPLPSET